MTRSFQNISVIKSVCLGKRASSLPTSQKALYAILSEVIPTSPNPAYSVVFNSKFKYSFDRKSNQIPPLGIRIQPDLQAIGFKQKDTLQYLVSSTPPWLLCHPKVNYSLRSLRKDDTALGIFRHNFYELCALYNNYKHRTMRASL